MSVSTTQQRVRIRWESITLPAPQSRGTIVRIPLHERSGFYVTSRHDPLTGIDWWFAVDAYRWDSPHLAPSLGEPFTFLSHAVWMHEGLPRTPVTLEMVKRGFGWFQPTAEALVLRRHAMRENRREEFKRINLARQQGTHLLRCDGCRLLSDLSARSWQMRSRVGAKSVTLCPACANKPKAGEQ